MKALYLFSLLQTSVLVAALQPLVADTNIVISKGFIGKLCSDNCRQVKDGGLLEDCERGCRFFDYAETSGISSNNNETAFHSLCVGSCNEAYVEVSKRESCTSGCDFAKKELANIIQMGSQLLEEADKQMNFLNSIFDMMSSAVWSDSEDDADFEAPKLLQRHPFMSDGLSRINPLDKSDDGQVEIIHLMDHDMTAMDPAEATLCATRMWLHRLSFILIVMGSLSLLFISFFYLLALMKQKKLRERELACVSDASMEPPSYETLVKNGCIVISKNGDLAMVAPVHEFIDNKKELKEKLISP